MFTFEGLTHRIIKNAHDHRQGSLLHWLAIIMCFKNSLLAIVHRELSLCYPDKITGVDRDCALISLHTMNTATVTACYSYII